MVQAQPLTDEPTADGGVSSDRSTWVGLVLYTIVRLILGLVLLIAAALKAHSLVAGSANHSVSPALSVAQIAAEALLGGWLLSGLLPRLSGALALICFAAFAVVAGHEAWIRAETCGCFGTVRVDPLSVLAFDLSAVAALASIRPWRRVMHEPLSRTARATALGCVLMLVVTSGVLGKSLLSREQSADLQVLEPAEWIGQEFPLLSHIDRGGELAEGKWLVVLYHHDCPSCRDAMPRYLELSRAWATGEIARICFVKMPPYGHAAWFPAPKSSDPPWLTARLDRSKEWFAKTPLEVAIVDGRVVKSRQELLATRADTVGQ